MNRFRFLLRQRLADFREWIGGRRSWRFQLVLLACLIVGLTAILSSEYLPSPRGFSEGNPAPRQVVADKTVTVQDVQATNELKQRVAQLVAPIYMPDSGALGRATGKLEGFLFQVTALRQQVATSLDVPIAIQRLRQAAPAAMSDQTLQYLLTANDSDFDLVQQQALGALETVYASPITPSTTNDAETSLRSIADRVAASPATAKVLYELAAGYIAPNQIVDEARTQARRQAAMNDVAPVTVSINQGETVLQKGQTITGQDILILRALGLLAARTGWKVWLGIFLIVLLEVAVFSRMLYRFNKTTEGFGNNLILVLVVLLLGSTGIARLLVIQPLSAYIIPIAALGMVTAIILNARSSLLLVTLTAVNIGILTDFDMRYAAVAVIVGTLALYLVSRVTKRTALLAAGLGAMFIAAFTIFSVELFANAGAGHALRMCLWGLASGAMAGVLTIIGLMILETVFDLTTPLRLLELADPAHPLLKKLLQVAPGTYNHSIQMGNLAEAAAESIGANPLLARVGAYYHDIGKTIRPEYFVENQIYVENPHDRLSPNLSKLAITAHVRDGEHLGRVYGLPQPIIDVIKQHHGTSVLAFFYHKARQTGKDMVYEENYRYEEQKPQSKEAAIIMLADSVEAAVRAMDSPTRRKIQGVIQEVIKQKIEDGQLDESALTQGDLHRIRDSFDTSLLGLVGHRIRYPEREDGGGRAGGSGRPSRPPSARASAGHAGNGTKVAGGVTEGDGEGITRSASNGVANGAAVKGAESNRAAAPPAADKDVPEAGR